MKHSTSNIFRYIFFGLAVVAASEMLRNLFVSNLRSAAATGARSPAVARGGYLVRFAGCADCHTPKKMGARGPEGDISRWLAGHPEEMKLTPPPATTGGPWIASTVGGLTAWSGPWGISYAANLTPDVNTGLGIWTEEMFVRAMRTGKHMGSGRGILPPMPWEGIAKLTDDDLKAVFAYLRSIPPVTNHVPAPNGPDGSSYE